MPRAHPTAIRDQILSLRSQGLSLVQIASQLLLPYSSVRRLCRRHRDDPARPLNPDYSRCGRRHTAATEALFQAACALKRNHPTWGAGIIRVQLSEQYPGQAMPSVRALQQAFRRAGVNRPRPPRPSTPATPRATVPHQIWEVDAKERVRLASGQRVSWLAFTDEASGALLATPLSPPGALAERPPHRDPGHVPPHVHPLGPARGGPCRQRVSLGVTARPAHRTGVVVDRLGRRRDLESPRPAAQEPQGRALSRGGRRLGRTTSLCRPGRVERSTSTGSAGSNAGSIPRSAAPRGSRPTRGC